MMDCRSLSTAVLGVLALARCAAQNTTDYEGESLFSMVGRVRGCMRCRERGGQLESERQAFLTRAPTLEDNARFVRSGEPRSATPRWRL
jgi:hypothetical protein